MDELCHVVGDLSAVKDAYLKVLLAKVHHVAQVYYQLAALCHVQNPLCAVIAAGRGIEYLSVVKLHEQQGLDAARKLQGSDASQHGAFDDAGAHDAGTVDVLDHFDRVTVCDPGITVGVLEIDRGVKIASGISPK